MKAKAIKEVKFLAPNFSMSTYRVLQVFGGLYLRIFEGVSRISVTGMENLYHGIIEHQTGENRLLILFRHVAKEDAPVVLGSIIKNLSKWCKKNGKRLISIPHVHFLYGKDVLNWAGSTSRWLLPRIAGIPVINHKVYKPSIQAIKQALKEGRFPLAFAPEGQVTYHMFKTEDIAPGATVFTRWAREELIRQSKKGKVILLPVAIGYKYGVKAEKLIKENIRYISDFMGINPPNTDDTKDTLVFLADNLVAKLEHLFADTCPTIMKRNTGQLETIRERVLYLCDRILHYTEMILEVPKRGDSILERIFRLRYKIVNTIYREDADPETLPPIERIWADYRAFHASLLKQNEEIVDALEYLNPRYIEENSSDVRMAEFSMILRDITNRINGGNIDSRYSPKGKTAHLHYGNPIKISAVEGKKPQSRREEDKKIRKVVKSALQKVSNELEDIIT